MPLALSTLAVVVGIAVAVLLSHLPAFDFVRFLGSRTLPIYLVHTFPMTALAAVAVACDVRVPTVVATALPLLLCGGAMALALALYRRFRAIPGVFTVPVKSWVMPPQRAVMSAGPQS